MDRFVFELKLDPEEAANKIALIIQSINALISTYQFTPEGCDSNLIISPEIGNVIFACGLHGWGFTLNDFAKRSAAPSG